MAVLFVLISIILALTVDYFILIRKKGQHDVLAEVPTPIEVFVPPATFIDPGHVWYELKPTGSLCVGISSLISGMMGNIDYVKRPKIGEKIKKGDVLFILKSGSKLLNIPSPLDCEVVGVSNIDFENVPNYAYSNRWLCKIITNDLYHTLHNSFIGSVANKWIREEVSKLRNIAVKIQGVGALADGGMPTIGFAQKLSHEQWDDLVKRFFRK